MTVVAALTAALLLSAASDVPSRLPYQSVSPATVQSQDEATRLDDVVVRGTLAEQVQSFVGEIASNAAPRGRFLANWQDRICPGVVNLNGDLARSVLDRIAVVAADLEVQTGAPGCNPNVVIIFTNDGAGLASAMVAREPDVFEHPNVGAFNRGSADLAWFSASEAPVRWWHLSMPVDTLSRQRTVRLHGEKAQEIGAEGLLSISTVDVLYKVIIVVDVARTEDVNLAQLADYLAMISLAQVDPRAQVDEFNTVLNIFQRPAVPGLTDWDRSYLQALYSSASRRRNPNSRNDDVARLMLRDQRQPVSREVD